MQKAKTKKLIFFVLLEKEERKIKLITLRKLPYNDNGEINITR